MLKVSFLLNNLHNTLHDLVYISLVEKNTVDVKSQPWLALRNYQLQINEYSHAFTSYIGHN